MNKIKIFSFTIILGAVLLFSNNVQASTKKEGIDNFPADYQSYLREIAKKHPNWKYTADASKDNTFDVGSHQNQRVIAASKNKMQPSSVNLVAAARLKFAEALKKADTGVAIGSFSAGFKRCPAKILSIDQAISQIRLSEAENIPELLDISNAEEPKNAMTSEMA